MNDRKPLRRVVVGIPARNEADRLERCLASIVTAASRMPRSVDVTIVVACDSCTDHTNDLALDFATRSPIVETVVGRWGTAGGARRAAIGSGLAEQSVAADRCWVATTDADTVVPSDWLLRHAMYADAGFDAVAGVVELAADDDCSINVSSAFRGYYRFDTAEAHSHVHGANLGVRADRYIEAGGFPPVACSEDHALWNALGTLPDCRRISPTGLVVMTSARLHSRAAGGFADDLARAVA